VATTGRVATIVGSVLIASFLTSCGVLETEGRSVEAESVVRQYFTELAGASDDRGWSRLSESTRDGIGSRDAYVEALEAAAEGPEVADVRIAYEDDGYYQFEVTLTDALAAPYETVLFGPASDRAPIACQIGERTLLMVVLIAPFSEHDGISGDECKR
jgi:hypothetical protein